MSPSVTTELSGWGRFPIERCAVFRPEKRAELAAILEAGERESFAPRGLGRSYADTALNAGGGVLDLTRLNRLLAFDDATGALTCEAGVSFAEIAEIFLQRGWFLPVTPGTKFVTLGGAIANDIHGKNHHRDGSIASFVERFTLLTGTGEVLECSRESHPDTFWATLGGIGLTGVVLEATLRLKRIESAYVSVDYRRAGDVHQALALLSDSDARYQYSVAWIDCLAKGRSLGRSVLMQGNPAPASAVPAGQAPLTPMGRQKLAVPFDMPGFALNPFSIGAFNALYYGVHGDADGKLVHLEPYFYPLDAIGGWNRLYGARGFVQYQFVLPEATSAEGLVALLTRLSASGRASFLAVLKRFGPESGGWLSFPRPGYTLALDLPAEPGLVPFLRELDQQVLAFGGRVYLAKDAVLTPETFAAMYPQAGRFRALKAKLDPEGRFSSSMARRLGLVEA